MHKENHNWWWQTLVLGQRTINRLYLSFEQSLYIRAYIAEVSCSIITISLHSLVTFKGTFIQVKTLYYTMKNKRQDWIHHIYRWLDHNQLKCLLEIEGNRFYWLNIKVKERPFAEGSRDHSCARAFYLNKQSIENFILRSMYVSSTNATKWFIILSQLLTSRAAPR